MIRFAKPFPSLSIYRDGDGNGRCRPDQEEDKNEEEDFLCAIGKIAGRLSSRRLGFNRDILQTGGLA